MIIDIHIIYLEKMYFITTKILYRKGCRKGWEKGGRNFINSNHSRSSENHFIQQSSTVGYRVCCRIKIRYNSSLYFVRNLILNISSDQNINIYFCDLYKKYFLYLWNMKCMIGILYSLYKTKYVKFHLRFHINSIYKFVNKYFKNVKH